MEVLLWLTCGIFSAIIAQSKGRNFGKWLLLGLIFGLFALIAAAAMPKLEPKDDTAATTKAITHPLERKCPFCAEMIKSEAIVCKHCGRDVEPLILETPMPESQNETSEEAPAEEDAVKNPASSPTTPGSFIPGFSPVSSKITNKP